MAAKFCCRSALTNGYGHKPLFGGRKMNRSTSIALILILFLFACAPAAQSAGPTVTETPEASATPAFTPTPEATLTPTATPPPSHRIVCPKFTVEVTGTEEVRPTGGSCTEIKAKITVYEVVFEVNGTTAFGLIFGGNGEWLIATENVLSRAPSEDGTTMTVEVKDVGSLDIKLWITTAVEGVLQSQRAPEFSITDVNGVHHTLSEQRGKVVVMYFWYTTCKYCAEDIPNLIAAAKSHTDDAVFFMFDEEENEQTAQAYLLGLEDFGENVLQITQKDSENTSLLYSVFGTPTTIVIGPDSVVRYHAVGAIPPDVLAPYLTP